MRARRERAWKGAASFVLCIVMVVLINSNFASAQELTEKVTEATRSTINAALSIATPLLEAIIGDYSTNEFFFAKSLLLFLLFIVLNAIVRRIHFMEGREGTATILAIIISVLAVRFINENQLTLGLLLPYGTLGVAAWIFVPFLIIFFSIHNSSIGPGGRRIIWGIVTIIYFVLWSYRADQLGEVMNQIYMWAVILMVAMFLFDPYIHRYFGMFEQARIRNERIDNIIAEIDLQLSRLYSVPDPTPEIQRRIRSLEERRRKLVNMRSKFV